MWMTSPEPLEEDQPLTRIVAAVKPRGSKNGATLQADPEHTRLLEILDHYPEARRKVIEALARNR